MISLPGVLLVNGTLFGGGAEHVIATMARHLRAAGHKVAVAVIGRGGEVQRELVGEGIEVFPQIGDGLSTPAIARVLHDLARTRGFEVLHSHDTRSLIDVGVARLRHRSFRHMHTFHFGNYPHLPAKHLNLERLFCRIPDQLVAVGRVQRDTIASALWVSADRIGVVWNGVDGRANTAAAPAPAPGSPVVIGSLSTMGPQKGLPTLLEAASLLKDRGAPFHLVLVGDGPLRKDLESEAARRGLSGVVEFRGWLADASSQVLPTIDVFVQSSYWEAMSVVILEAMAARKPIVATSVGENPYVLGDGTSAILVPAKDAAALANALARVIEDAGLRARLGDAAQAAYRESFTGRAMADRYAAAYAALN